MVDAGIMEPSDSPFSFPVIVVEKKDGCMRLVCDLRRLNAQTVYQSCPSHITMDDLQQTLGFEGAKILSSLDLRSGYNQIVTRESDRQYCSIKLNGMLPVRCRRMAQGLVNAPATFQKVMNIVLARLSFEICLSYLDDIIVWSRAMNEHRNNLQLVFDRLRSAGLLIYPRKCDCAKTEAIFSGYILSGEAIQVDPDKSKKYIDFPRPKSVKGTRLFYGLASWFRRHVPLFSEVMGPRQELLRKDRATTFRWGQKQEEAFIKVKEILTNPPFLKLPDYTKTFYLCTDALERAISAILRQKADNGALKPLSFSCRSLRDSDIRRIPIHSKECLAVLYGLQVFDGYLRDIPFVISTDSRAITFMNKNEIMSSKLARWAVTIQSYPFTLEHVPAEQNGGLDALSRLRSYEDEPNADQELEEFLDKKILQVESNEMRKETQISTITFENDNNDIREEGGTEERQRLMANELADPGIEVNHLRKRWNGLYQMIY